MDKKRKLTSLLEALWDPAYAGVARHSDNSPDPTQRPAPPADPTIEEAEAIIREVIAGFESELENVSSQLFDVGSLVYTQVIGETGDFDETEDTALRAMIAQALAANVQQRISPDGIAQ